MPRSDVSARRTSGDAILGSGHAGGRLEKPRASSRRGYRCSSSTSSEQCACSSAARTGGRGMPPTSERSRAAFSASRSGARGRACTCTDSALPLQPLGVRWVVGEWGARGAVGARAALLSARLTLRRRRQDHSSVRSHSRGPSAVGLLRQLPIFQHSIATVRDPPERPPHHDGMSSSPVAAAAGGVSIRMLDVGPLFRGADSLKEVCATSAASHIDCKAAVCRQHFGDSGCLQKVADHRGVNHSFGSWPLRAAPAASMAGCGGAAVGRARSLYSNTST